MVRCKDCKHAHMTADGYCKYCDRIEGEHYFEGDFYCAYGECKHSNAYDTLDTPIKQETKENVK